MSDCTHADWTCFYERTSDGKKIAYCQRCGMESGWQWTMTSAESELYLFPRLPAAPSGSAEIFTVPA